MAEIRISTDKVCALVEALHEIEGLDFGTEIANADDEGDEAAITALEDSGDDPRPEQILEMIRGLSEDERIDLVALALVGREDYSIAQWSQAVAAASEQIDEGGRDFVGTFLTADMAAPEYLEAGLQLFGRSCADWDAETVTTAQGVAADDGGTGQIGDIVDAAQAQTPGTPPNLDPRAATKRTAEADPAFAAGKPDPRRPKHPR